MSKERNFSRPVWSILLALILVILLAASLGCTRTVYVPAPQQPAPQQPVPQQPTTQPPGTQSVQGQAPVTMPQVQNPAAASNRLWVYADPPMVSPFDEVEINIIGLTPGGQVNVTIYGPDGKIYISVLAFSEWDGDTEIELHPFGWAQGSYRAVCQDMTTGLQGEVTFSITGIAGPHYYDD